MKILGMYQNFNGADEGFTEIYAMVRTEENGIKVDHNVSICMEMDNELFNIHKEDEMETFVFNKFKSGHKICVHSYEFALYDNNIRVMTERLKTCENPLTIENLNEMIESSKLFRKDSAKKRMNSPS